MPAAETQAISLSPPPPGSFFPKDTISFHLLFFLAGHGFCLRCLGSPPPPAEEPLPGLLQQQVLPVGPQGEADWKHTGVEPPLWVTGGPATRPMAAPSAHCVARTSRLALRNSEGSHQSGLARPEAGRAGGEGRGAGPPWRDTCPPARLGYDQKRQYNNQAGRKEPAETQRKF